MHPKMKKKLRKLKQTKTNKKTLSNKTTLESVYSQVDVGDSGSLWWKSFTEL